MQGLDVGSVRKSLQISQDTANAGTRCSLQ